ncbi:DUF4280 domain-containing protein [Iocasia frigidifontis]|uniref:DUF4280 domain-containing protein n=1 Tax=Iocasia fonsfrigidae TaxID=2682810 RepID=A0A8A7KEN1_9FIRM|nr:DUF4280 domain-containing protein [Iocasia fonsfrigidae]QTL98128.1 DUF4280 domain-containing protein [Iocasia fonsfrigidae]
MIEINKYFEFDLENTRDFLNDEEKENREGKLKLGDNFIGKEIKSSNKELFDCEDCYGNKYVLKDNSDLHIYSSSKSGSQIHTLLIHKFEDGDYGLWLTKQAPYYYEDGKIVNYFTTEEATVGEITAINKNKYLQEENRIMDDFLWIYAGDDIIFPSEVEEQQVKQGEGNSDGVGSEAGIVAAGGAVDTKNGEEGENKKGKDSIVDIGKDGKLYVCHGAILKCSKGTVPCTLNVIDKHQVYLKSKPIATVDDSKPVNISSFATCKRHDSPPCTPKLSGKWKGGKESVLVHGVPVLLKTSTIKCAYGGTITIINPGQGLVSE